MASDLAKYVVIHDERRHAHTYKQDYFCAGIRGKPSLVSYGIYLVIGERYLMSTEKKFQLRTVFVASITRVILLDWLDNIQIYII